MDLARAPDDIVIRIMTSMASLDDIFHLASTCRRMRDLLSAFVGHICNGVTQRSIQNLLLARTLIYMQDEHQFTNAMDQAMDPNTHRITSLPFAQRLRLNHRRVEKAIAYLEDAFFRSGSFRDPGGYYRRKKALSSSERHRFEWAFYVVWLLLIDGQDEISQLIFSPREVMFLCAVCSLECPVGDFEREIQEGRKMRERREGFLAAGKNRPTFLYWNSFQVPKQRQNLAKSLMMPLRSWFGLPGNRHIDELRSRPHVILFDIIQPEIDEHLFYSHRFLKISGSEHYSALVLKEDEGSAGDRN